MIKLIRIIRYLEESDIMKVLVFGDVYGTRGQEALVKYLPKLKQDHKPNLIFVNGENIDKGFGITEKIYKELMKLGVSVVTMGNHTFRKKDLLEFIDDTKIIRPANYPDVVPGKGYITIKYNDKLVTVINMLGNIFMGDTLDRPYPVIDKILDEIDSDYIFVDFHAEATSEKLAFAHYLDGRVTAVYGTHTHVPTADAIRLPNGTLYISDVGMTGPLYGILGADKDVILKKTLTHLPSRIEESKAKELQLNAVIIDTVQNTIKPINIFEQS